MKTLQTETTITGRHLYYAFYAGANEVFKHHRELNAINVFPSHDKDTGTNFTETLKAIILNTVPKASFRTTLDDMAQAALRGARGTSGVIFAQLLYGLSQTAEHKIEFSLNDFVKSYHQAIYYVYEALPRPQEGTILTVISAWSQFFSGHHFTDKNQESYLMASAKCLEKALFQTNTHLKVLKKNRIVDAGAQAFVIFVKGAIDFLLKRHKIHHFEHIVPQQVTPVHYEANASHDFRYCMETFLSNCCQEVALIKHLLSQFGHDAIVAGDNVGYHIHVHTNMPHRLLPKLCEIGNCSYTKIEDILRQTEWIHHKKWNIAVVTDSSCDLPREILDYYQVNILPISIFIDGVKYEDSTTIRSAQFYKELDSSLSVPTTSAVTEQQFLNLYRQLFHHYDAIISLHLSSHMSETYNNSLTAAGILEREYQKEIYTIDSRSISGSLGLSVFKACKLIDLGYAASHVSNVLQYMVEDTRIFVVLKKNGQFGEK